MVAVTVNVRLLQTGVVLSLLSPWAMAQCEIAKLSDGKPNGYFANAVAVSGTRLAATCYIGPGIGVGSVCIFERQGTNWSQSALLQTFAGEGFGLAFALDNDRLVVGAPSESTKGVSAGAAYVFDYAAGVWNQSAKLFASDATSLKKFGRVLAVDGDRILVTAFNVDHGSAYVFDRDEFGHWGESTKLDPVGWVGLDYYGYSCALDGDVAVVGAPTDAQYGFQAGAAYIFERSPLGVWSQSAKLPAPPGQWQFISRFGTSVGVHGDTIFIGAPVADGLTPGAGAVFLYRRSPLGDWELAGKVFASDGSPGWFGEGLAVDGDVLLVAAPVDDAGAVNTGSLYVFIQHRNGTWSEVAKLTSSDATAFDHFGHAVSLSGNIAAIGTFPDNSGIPPQQQNPGAVYLYAVGPDNNGNGVMDACECPGDINKDWIVDQQDLGALLAAYGTCEGDPGFNPKANLAPGPAPLCPPGVEGIDQADLGVLLANYGMICP